MFFKILLVALAITANVCSEYAPSTDYKCISSCVGKQDGYYPLCGGNCNIYALCKYGYLEEKSCPLAKNTYGNLQLTRWDQDKQECEETSSTCVVTGECISSCKKYPDGNYQSCVTCNGYATCGGGIFREMPCPAGLEWDDEKKSCEYSSPSCKPPVQGQCVSDCESVPNGDYQKCNDCYNYVSCSGYVISYRSCPPTLQWDDISKRCDYTSRTCTMPSN